MASRPRWGQHFLTDANIVDEILTACAIEPHHRVLEVGPGTGALTDRILSTSCKLTLIERDPELAARWRPMHDKGQLHLVQADVLTHDWHQQRFDLVVSNLPYEVSGPFVAQAADAKTDHLVLMLQKEFADRLIANPSNKAYGRITVPTQLCFEVREVCAVPPTSFDPPPRVDSSVLELQRRGQQPTRNELDLVRAICKRVFQARRKKLSNAAKNFQHQGRTWPLAAAINARDLSDRRAEDIAPTEYLAIARQLVQDGPDA